MADLRIADTLGLGKVLGGADASKVKGDSGFGQMLGEALQNTVDAQKTAEATSAQAVSGKADVTDVVTAVTNAEMALDTVVAVRDRVISAYQEILRMPI
ncbi:MAG: flagellar hook-basal body complex protein FliE [Ferrovibrio sp.]|uniref:flagellar hook-basal body complex protein FliE n=1 Tax=Ferrovibrio sp. TaxID=1917215 RepID=UPI00261E95CD|nr:flagellar hook-basal body complex protein FliE [Ferrovibrio sp.]MCW0234245.1 flagellar hook-basal body complex protein FliE [Ferrovibrio sp.]